VRALLQHFRRLSPATWLSLASLVAAALMLWRPLAYFLRCHGPIAFDDGYTVALAERIIDHHWLPYVDGCSHRGPLLYWSTAVFQALFGRFSWVGPRYLVAIVNLATLGGVYLAALWARRPVAAATAVLVQVWLVCAYDTASVFGVTGEIIASCFSVYAFAFTSLALVRLEGTKSRFVVLLLAGLCAAAAGLAKQTALPAVSWTERETPGSRRLVLVAALVGGFALPFVIVLGRYAASHQLSTFWYWYYTYNADVYMAPHRHDSLRKAFDPLFDDRSFALLGLGLAVIGVLAARVAALGPRPIKPVRAYVSGAFELTLTLLTLLALLGALAPMRFFFHYFVPLFPLVALLVGVGFERTLVQSKGSRLGFGLASVLVVLGVLSVTLFANDRVMRGLREYRHNGGWTGAYPEPVCAYIDAHSRPGSPLFIWGFDGDIYVTCRRKPASRFVYMTLVAGSVPDRAWQAPNPKFVARGAREQLMADLQESEPDVVLDMPYNMKGVSASTVPELNRYLRANYCKQPTLKTKDTREATPWIRRGRPDCP
jgi:hypothetical protein